MRPATRSGEACESGTGRKTPQEREGRPTSHVSCKQTHQLAGAAAPPSNQELETCKSSGGRKTPQERGEDPLPT
jgi:hypothetical protein